VCIFVAFTLLAFSSYPSRSRFASMTLTSDRLWLCTWARAVATASIIMTARRENDNTILKADPLFLRTFKLKGMEEEELMDTLTEIEEWINMVEFRFSEGSAADYAADLIMRVRREYHGAMNCTVSGDYELAVLEMRRAVDNLGRALLAVAGQFDFDQTGLIQQLKENEPVFYENIMVRYGAFDFTQKGVERSIGEARFIAQRL
ncbi:MAG: hypothetical protein ACFE7R_06620, partial [Candidatus Hodarchaeota archaeon]